MLYLTYHVIAACDGMVLSRTTCWHAMHRYYWCLAVRCSTHISTGVAISGSYPDGVMHHPEAAVCHVAVTVIASQVAFSLTVCMAYVHVNKLDMHVYVVAVLQFSHWLNVSN